MNFQKCYQQINNQLNYMSSVVGVGGKLQVDIRIIEKNFKINT